jgi:hypothetical protein
MTTLAVTNQITTEALVYAPALMAGVQAIETIAPPVSGATKQSILLNKVLIGVEVGSGALESSPNPTVASCALLVNLFASLIKAFKTAPTVAATAAAAAAAASDPAVKP